MKRDDMVKRALSLSETAVVTTEGNTSKVVITFTGGSLEVVIGARGAIKRWSSCGIPCKNGTNMIYYIINGGRLV